MSTTMSRRTAWPRVVSIASIVTVAFAGSVVVTPLYSLYQAKFGFSDIVLTLIYAAYVVGNVTALLVFGQVSDQIGRKRVALPALGVSAAGALSFLFADGTAWLFAGRILIGLSVGMLSGTGTAWLAEQFSGEDGPIATVTAATANLIGIGLGPLVGGVLAEYVAHPLVIPLIAYLVAVAAVIFFVARVPEDRSRPAAGWRSVHVRPRVGVPRDRLRSFAAPAVTGFVTFALGGLYFALIPSIVIRDLGVSNVAVGGLIVFELGAVAAVLIVLGRRVRPAPAMITGLLCLLPAVGLVVAAQAARSMPLLVVAAALAAIPMSVGYRGSLQVVNAIAPDDRRAEVVSSYLMCCFVGNSVPVIGIGVLSTYTTPLEATMTFAITIGVLALGALAWHRLDPDAPR